MSKKLKLILFSILILVCDLAVVAFIVYGSREGMKPYHFIVCLAMAVVILLPFHYLLISGWKTKGK